MKVRITVSSSGKAQNVGESRTITIADVKSIEEIGTALKDQFGDMFPRHATLDQTTEKKSKKKVEADGP